MITLHWTWLLICFGVGTIFGFLVACILAASGWASREEELIQSFKEGMP